MEYQQLGTQTAKQESVAIVEDEKAILLSAVSLVLDNEKRALSKSVLRGEVPTSVENFAVTSEAFSKSYQT